jgi:glycosyltransferase involved in cell wall biosynthesis
MFRSLLSRLRLFLYLFFKAALILRIKNNNKNYNHTNLITSNSESGLNDVLLNFYSRIKKNKKKFYLNEYSSNITFIDHNSTNIFFGNLDIPINLIFSKKNYRLLLSKNICVFFWELENLPLKWICFLRIIDEFWVHSDFLFNVLSKYNVNVKKIPFDLKVKCLPKYNRHNFNLPLDKFIFYFSFDFNSYLHRKNPHGLIHTFIKFSKKNKNSFLYIKTTNAMKHEDDFLILKGLIKNCNNIRIENIYFTKIQNNSLMACIDCFISLHRSEGFGLLMAEAMMLKIPVIATNYSGNLEFMNQNNSFLVNSHKISVNENEYIYSSNQKWADPDLNHACKVMDLVFSNKKKRKLVADVAYGFIFKKYGSKSLDNFLNSLFN